MATVTVSSKVTTDGSLTIPSDAIAELGLHSGDEVKVQVESKNGFVPRPMNPELARAIEEMMKKRTPEHISAAQARANAMYKPEREVPPGMTLADIVCGKWPGDETDEQVYAALCELS